MLAECARVVLEGQRDRELVANARSRSAPDAAATVREAARPTGDACATVASDARGGLRASLIRQEDSIIVE